MTFGKGFFEKDGPFGRGSSYAPLAPLGTKACDARGRASRLERTIQSDFLDLEGRPLFRFFRRACNCLKYSGPRLAIAFPPFRPSLTAAGSFFLGKIQRASFSLLTILCMTNNPGPRRRTKGQRRIYRSFRRERPYFRGAANRVIREETRRAPTLPEVHEALEAC